MGMPFSLPNRHPLATASEVARPYVPSRFLQSDMPVLAEHFDLAKARPEEIAALCMDEAPIKAALGVSALAHNATADSKPRDVAVYVIGPDNGEVAKVGFAKRPENRLNGLQTGSWLPLSIHALFWCVDGEAKALEYEAHDAAKGAGIKRRGEWFTASPELMSLVIATVAHAKGYKVADSAMWLRQREAVRQQVRFLNQGERSGR
jgi:hypothetical protein